MINKRITARHSARMCLALLLCCIICGGMVQAYELAITTPTQLQRGMPLVVNGTSNIPPGNTVDIVLSRTGHVTEEIAREPVTLQANQVFTVIFDTTDLLKGIYKVEVPPISSYAYLGDSVTLRVVEIVDRSDEVTFRTPKTQEMDGTLTVEGIINSLRGSGVQIEVIGPGDRVVSGSAYVPVKTDGSFTLNVPITEAGLYRISFTDGKGYIGTFKVTVTEKPEPVSTTLEVTPANRIVSESAPASRDRPATFAIHTGTEPARVFTSSGFDWVLEYRDATGEIVRVNEKGSLGNEEVTLNGTGGVILVTVYPFSYSVDETVLLSAEGADRIGIATPVTTATTASGTTAGKSPLPLILVVIAVIAAAAFLIIRRYW